MKRPPASDLNGTRAQAGDASGNPSSEREGALFQAAAQLTGPARAAFLDQVGAEDPELRARLDARLQNPHDAATFLRPGERTPDGEPARARPLENLGADEELGQVIGHYKLLEKVGEGGWGVVYVAEQTAPVRRRVALKVIKLGMDTKQVVARFEAERQALAMMDHPNIAKVLDAGATAQGRPYFVMELVRGIRITDYCDQNHLATKERLDLFIKVCEAIQHAHQKGIIHRDIKPSNILVTLHDGVPVPKVIDFGIAKATEGRLTDATVYTQLHQFIGTPAYMSPEQAEMSGLDIDTRSDVYSLGVLLYELLAGSTPFDAKELMASGIDAMRKTIREKEPVRPSTRLSQTRVAADVRRLQSPASDTPSSEEEVRASSRRLLRIRETITLLKGDLDWIVMKCLEKDRTRRYETANGLAADLKRHLNNEPVVARPPSAGYRFRKAVRRNQLVFGAAMAIAVALVLGLVVSSVLFLREQRARQEAARKGDEARRSEQAAIAAQGKAERERERTRRLSYASDMNVAWRALKENNLAEVTALLEGQIPGPGDSDLRGWEWRYFWQSCRGDQLWSLGPMQDKVLALALLPEGRLAAGVTGRSAEVRVWDPERRQTVRRRALEPDNLSGMAVSPDGRRMAVATWQTRVRLLDAASLESTGELQHEKPIWRVDFSPDGKLLSAHGSEDVSVWEIATRKRLWSTNTPWGSPSTAPFSPDGKWVACQLSDGSLALLGAVDGALLQHGEPIDTLSSRLAISPDGRWLAAGNWNGETILTDPGATQIKVLTNHHAAVRAVAFSPDSRQLATAGDDRLVKLWDVESSRETTSFRGHRKGIMSLVYSADGQWLFTGAADGTVCAWPARPSRSEPSANWPAERSIRMVSRDGRFVAGFETNGVCHVVSLEDMRETGSVALAGELECLAVGPGGREIAAGQKDGTVRVYDLAEGKLAWGFQAHSNQVDALAFSPDGSRLATAGRGLEVRVWDLKERRSVLDRLLGVVGDHVNDLAFAHDSATLVVPAYGKIHLISLRPGDNTRELKLKADVPFSVDISHDGTLVAVGMDEEVRVWEVASLRQVAQLRGSLGAFNSVSFSPDHRRVVASDSVGVTWVWDLATSREVGRFEAIPGYVHARFQPSGDTLVIALFGMGFDQLRLLRAPSWAEITAAEGEQKKPGRP